MQQAVALLLLIQLHTEHLRTPDAEVYMTDPTKIPTNSENNIYTNYIIYPPAIAFLSSNQPLNSCA